MKKFRYLFALLLSLCLLLTLSGCQNGDKNAENPAVQNEAAVSGNMPSAVDGNDLQSGEEPAEESEQADQVGTENGETETEVQEANAEAQEADTEAEAEDGGEVEIVVPDDMGFGDL